MSDISLSVSDILTYFSESDKEVSPYPEKGSENLIETGKQFERTRFFGSHPAVILSFPVKRDSVGIHKDKYRMYDPSLPVPRFILIEYSA